MLRMIPSTSSEGAKRYFREALSTGEYYLDQKVLGQEAAGRWGGEGARRLGLAGEVERDAYEALCDNRRPDGSKLTVRDAAGRRVGYDLNFHVPKSVSVLHELTGDERIVDAFREAVDETMRAMEREVATRVRRGDAHGTREQRAAGNLIWAEFIHRTSRPVDGVPDPHLHAHCFCFNATYDPVEERWKAADFGDLKRDAPYHQAAYHARLARKLGDLGYEIERRPSGRDRTKEGWEIVGVPESVVRAYSRRTAEIEKLAAEQKITDPEKKAELGARTRKAKLATKTMEELRGAWSERLSEQEAEALKATYERAAGERRQVLDRDEILDAALDYASEHCFERSSVASQRRLVAAALDRSVGRVTLEGMAARLDELVRSGGVIRRELEGQLMVTTREVVREETEMLRRVREGRGRHDPLRSEHEIQDAELSAEQRQAVEHVLGSSDSVILVRGLAGAGKTRLMREVAGAVEATGMRLQATAPRSMTTDEVLRKDGYADARTVSFFLKSEKLQKELAGQVLWVDEAGQLSMPDLQRLVAIAETNETRLLLTGDTRQHRSVLRGDAMRLLESESGLKIAEVTEIRRQEPADYRAAAQALAEGDLIKGVEGLEKMGAIMEVERDERAAVAAAEYLKHTEANQQTLVVSPTHAEGREVTAAIRERLKDAGRVAGEETAVARLTPAHLTEAQKREWSSYRVGDVLQFQKHAGNGLKAADRAEVVGVERGVVTLRNERDGRLVSAPLKEASRFEVYEKGTLKLAAGDRVRLTRNGYADRGQHRLHNGAVYRVSSIDEEGNLTLTNGWRIRAGYGHLDHGYVVTSDASQGRTVDQVILVQSEASRGAASEQQFYVSATRGRRGITVITSDLEELMKGVVRDTSRTTATEFLRAAVLPPRLRGMEQRRAIGRWLMQRKASGRAKSSRERSQSRGRNARRQERNRGRRGRDRGGLQRER